MNTIANMPANYSEVINPNTFLNPEESLRIDLFFLSLAVTTFYRKSFTFRYQGAFIISCFVGFFIWGWDCWDLPAVSIFVKYTYKIFIILFTINELKQDVKTLDKQDLLNISVMEILLHQLNRGLFTTLDLWKAILFISPLQLVRKPIFLKNLRRPVRVSAGPVSIILALAAGTLQLKESISGISILFEFSQLVLVLSSLVVIMSAVLAGVVFRPDNTEFLQLVHPHHVKYGRRVEIHAAANAVILIIALVRVLAGGL
jgi:hypothetical protein